MDEHKKSRKPTIGVSLYLFADFIFDWIGRSTVMEDAKGIPKVGKEVIEWFNFLSTRWVLFAVLILFLGFINWDSIKWLWGKIWIWRKPIAGDTERQVSHEQPPHDYKSITLQDYFIPSSRLAEATASAANVGASPIFIKALGVLRLQDTEKSEAAETQWAKDKVPFARNVKCRITDLSSLKEDLHEVGSDIERIKEKEWKDKKRVGASLVYESTTSWLSRIQGLEKRLNTLLTDGVAQSSKVKVYMLKASSYTSKNGIITAKAHTRVTLERQLAERWQNSEYCVILESD